MTEGATDLLWERSVGNCSPEVPVSERTKFTAIAANDI
jgi:hypothetical protein